MTDTEWGYREDNGPATWPGKFPSAAGSRQSPVDIVTKDVKSDTTSAPLNIHYPTGKAFKLINSGYGWKVDLDGQGTELTGGPLEGTYRLEQFHCHWGCTSEKGSEHTIDGQAYAGELHLVHWNCTKYATFAEAAAHADGLAVLGVFLKAGLRHQEMEKITSLLSQVTYKGDATDSSGSIDLSLLLPPEKRYYTYQGSLTTPPCTESVIWIVFKQPVDVSEDQLNKFRSLRCYKQGCDTSCCDEGLIVNNFRPPLPLGNRELRECGSI